MESIKLNNGISMPLLGLGMFQMRDREECARIVDAAIQMGYRKFDTAALYGNESVLGEAVRRSNIPREAFFITSKLWVQDAGYDLTLRAFERSLTALGLDYLDAYLVHQPYGDYYGSWRAMEELYGKGVIHSVGVSNFSPERLTDLCLHAEVKPALNQIECHPFYQQKEYMRLMGGMAVHLEAWAPLAEGSHRIFTHPVLAAVGGRHGKTPAQVALRFLTQQGISVNPKTVHEDYLKENLEIFDFQLDERDIEKLTALDTEQSEIIDHANPGTVRMICGYRIRSAHGSQRTGHFERKV